MLSMFEILSQLGATFTFLNFLNEDQMILRVYFLFSFESTEYKAGNQRVRKSSDPSARQQAQ